MVLHSIAPTFGQGALNSHGCYLASFRSPQRRSRNLPSIQRALSECATQPVSEICVCTNKTCRRQGSQQILKTLEDLELDGIKAGHRITVRSCGCLGGCGSGPNARLSPSGLKLLSIQTPASVFKLLREYCGVEISDDIQKCVQLKAQATHLAQKGNLEAARGLYSDALKIAPPYLAYKLHSNLSLVALACGDNAAAQNEAMKALEGAPKDFTTAKIRMIQACLAANKPSEAEEFLYLAVQDDRSFAATPLYKELAMKVMKCVSDYKRKQVT